LLYSYAYFGLHIVGISCGVWPARRRSDRPHSRPPLPRQCPAPVCMAPHATRPPGTAQSQFRNFMSRFSLRYPFFIIVACLITAVMGVTGLLKLPVDLFPEVKIPIVVVATFYNGMPPEEVENKITGPFERFFTLGSGIEHIESRSLPGVSLIKIFFQPGTDPSAALSSVSNLAMADLRRLPPGTLPPVILKFDASSMPVCLITLKGEGLSEARLRDLAQYDVRNQVASVPGASVPQPS